MTAEGAAETSPAGREQGIYTTYAFISSSLSELRPEREALDRGLTAVAPHFYDHEHGAAFEAHRDEWRHDITRCHVYIGIYWKKLGPWTKDELEFAAAQGKPMLLYFKGPYEWDGREPELAEFVASLGDVDRQGAAFFEDPPDPFARLVNADLEREKSRAFASSLERRRQIHAEESDLTYTPTTDGGRADEADEAAPAAARRAQVATLEPFAGVFLDRADVLAELVDALEEDAGEELIEVVGPKGMGKGAVLERLLAEDLGGFPDGAGVNPVGAGLDDLDDLLRTVFDAFYESSDPEVVTAWSAETLRAHLTGTQEGTRPIAALVVFEDVPPGSTQFAELRSALPRSLAVCVTSEAETGEGLDVPVAGFEDPADVLALFEQRYKAPIPEKAQELVLAACALVGNAPGAIRELGRLASREAKPVPGLEPLVAWARAKAESPPEEVLTRGGAAKEAVRALIAAGGEAPAEVIGDVAGHAGAGSALAVGAIEPGSPRYRLGGVVTHDVAGGAGDEQLMGAILDSAVRWAERARLDEICDDRAFVQRMVDWGVRHGRHEDVVRLAQAADPALAMGVRWGAWEQVLLGALEAAKALGDRPCAEGWAHHQLGTRALLRGDKAGAREHLTEALDLRRAYCRQRSADLTEHNLRLATPPRPRLLPPVIRLLPGLLAVVVVLLLAGLFGPRGGIADFDVPFGAVQVTPGEDTLQLFRLGPEEYTNDGAAPLEVAITLDGDQEFCLAVAGADAGGGQCVDGLAGTTGSARILTCTAQEGGFECGQEEVGSTSLGRAPPVAAPVPGMPLAQGAVAAGCEIFAGPEPDSFVLLIAPGGSCPVLFGFDPPDQPGLDLAATATFSTSRGASWAGELTGSTFDVDPVLEVVKTVDADGDGEFASMEEHPAAEGEATFAVTIRNVREGSALVLTEIADNRYGDVTDLAGTDCEVGGAIPPGGSYSCRYRGPVAPTDGARFVNIVTATIELAGDPFSESAEAAVLFPGSAAVVVGKQVDADGDGAFARSERFPGEEPGPVEYLVTVANRSTGDVTITSITDDAFGDLAAREDSSCGTGVVVPPGGEYDCRFTAEVDPREGQPHRNTVDVAVDPPLESPYAAQAVVTFASTVEVVKTVDADADGQFRQSESLRLPTDDRIRPFRVTVQNSGTAPVDLIALRDSSFGDEVVFGDSDCATGVTIGAGERYQCSFRAPIDGDAGTQHENVVTATVATPAREVDIASNRVIVPLVLGPESLAATLAVDADGDGAFGAEEEAPEGAPRDVTYRIAISQPEGSTVNLGSVLVAPFGDVADAGDCTPGTSVAQCRFTSPVGGDAGDSLVARLDTGALISEPGESTATVRFVDVPPVLAVAATGPAAAAPSERVTITATVRNRSVATDDVTLTALETAAGTPLAGLDASTCRLVTLEAPDGATSCTFRLTVSGSAGGVQSITVVATGTDDEGNAVTASGGHSIAVQPVLAGLDVVKSLDGNADEDGSNTVSVGDTLTYRVVVLNVGDQALTGVTVSDPDTGLAGACGGVTTLAPGASTTCTAPLVVTGAHLAAGEVVNTACASATAPSGPVDGCDTHRVPVPGLTLAKELAGNADQDGSGSISLGDRLTYGYRVTAASRFTAVTVTDPMPGLGPIVCTPGNGAPLDDTMVCTADYFVTQADVDAGFVANIARATGTTPGGQTVVVADELVVPIVPSLVVAVVTDPPSGAAFGFTGAVAAQLRNGERAALSAPAGFYQVTAASVPDHWTLTAISCQGDADSAGDVGARTATFRLAGPERVTCTFAFRGEPVIDVQPELVEFGPVAATTESSPRQITVTNVGTSGATLGPITAPGGFAVRDDGCSGVALPPAAQCTFAVVFQPPDAGGKAGVVAVPSNASGDDGLVVTGTGA